MRRLLLKGVTVLLLCGNSMAADGLEIKLKDAQKLKTCGAGHALRGNFFDTRRFKTQPVSYRDPTCEHLLLNAISADRVNGGYAVVRERCRKISTDARFKEDFSVDVGKNMPVRSADHQRRWNNVQRYCSSLPESRERTAPAPSQNHQYERQSSAARRQGFDVHGGAFCQNRARPSVINVEAPSPMSTFWNGLFNAVSYVAPRLATVWGQHKSDKMEYDLQKSIVKSNAELGYASAGVQGGRSGTYGGGFNSSGVYMPGGVTRGGACGVPPYHTGYTGCAYGQGGYGNLPNGVQGGAGFRAGIGFGGNAGGGFGGRTPSGYYGSANGAYGGGGINGGYPGGGVNGGYRGPGPYSPQYGGYGQNPSFPSAGGNYAPGTNIPMTGASGRYGGGFYGYGGNSGPGGYGQNNGQFYGRSPYNSGYAQNPQRQIADFNYRIAQEKEKLRRMNQAGQKLNQFGTRISEDKKWMNELDRQYAQKKGILQNRLNSSYQGYQGVANQMRGLGIGGSAGTYNPGGYNRSAQYPNSGGSRGGNSGVCSNSIRCYPGANNPYYSPGRVSPVGSGARVGAYFGLQMNGRI